MHDHGRQDRSEVQDAQREVLDLDTIDCSYSKWRFESMLRGRSEPDDSSSSGGDVEGLAQGSVWIGGQLARPVRDFVPRLRRSSEAAGTSSSSERWEGVVLEVADGTFRARLVDLDRHAPDEDAEIYWSEVSDEDKDLVEPGAVFYWSIGYYTDRMGQRVRRSLIRFRRLPTWTERELEDARLEAEKTARILGWGA